MTERWFEDFRVGDRFVSPGYTFTESEIIDFALRYDPQPFHMDRTAAERSPYGGLIASGWQIGSIAFRLFTMTNPFGRASQGSPGLDELRWLRPVRPGDTIRMEAEVIEVRASASRPDRGIAVLTYRALNQNGEPVMSMRAAQLLARRPAETPAG